MQICIRLYGMHLDEQSALLDNIRSTFSTIRVGQRRPGVFAPFQKGIIMLAESVQCLFLDLKEKVPGVNYIMLSHLNQDYVENVFSMLRSYRGFSFNPNGVQFKYRLRKLILSWNLLKGFDLDVDYNVLTGSVQSDFVTGIFDERVEEPQEFETRVFNSLLRIDTNVDSSKKFKSGELNREELVTEGSKEAVAGRIARAFHQEYPEFSLNADPDKMRDLWVDKVSKGGLTSPSDLWLAYFSKFEEHFIAVNGYFTIDKQPRIVSRFEELLVSTFPALPKEVIRFYSKCRMFIRIEYLNKRIEDEKFMKLHQRTIAMQAEDSDDNPEEQEEDVSTVSEDAKKLFELFANSVL